MSEEEIQQESEVKDEVAAAEDSAPVTEQGTDTSNEELVAEVGEVNDSIEQEEEPEKDSEAENELSEEDRLIRIAELKPIVEGAIMAAGEAIKISRIQGLFEEREVPGAKLLREVMEAIKADCVGRGFDLLEVASGWRFQVREDYAAWVNRLWDEKPQRYSRALLETLALIAYRQPITRGDIEEVRGVAVSSHIIKTLSERDWVKVVGHRDVPGRPALYATTRQFLDYFNMKSLEDLPALSELKDIDSLNASLDLGPLSETGDEVEAETDNSETPAATQPDTELEGNAETAIDEKLSEAQSEETQDDENAIDSVGDQLEADSDAEEQVAELHDDAMDQEDEGDEPNTESEIEAPVEIETEETDEQKF